MKPKFNFTLQPDVKDVMKKDKENEKLGGSNVGQMSIQMYKNLNLLNGPTQVPKVISPTIPATHDYTELKMDLKEILKKHKRRDPVTTAATPLSPAITTNRNQLSPIPSKERVVESNESTMSNVLPKLQLKLKLSKNNLSRHLNNDLNS